MPVPKGFVLDAPTPQTSPASAINLPKGFVLDQQPQQPQQPAPAPALSLTDNPDREGTYAMWNTSGQKQQVPYSKVSTALGSKYQFDTNPDQSGLPPAARYQKDLNYQLQQSLPPSPAQKLASGLGDVAAGVGKGAAHTFLNVADAGQRASQWQQNHLPAWMSGANVRPKAAPTPAQNRAWIAGQQDKMQPGNLPQKLGFYGEQAGEFLAPMGIEEAATEGLTKLPYLAKAPQAARLAVGSLSSGLVNKAQGGSFGSGAAAGAAGGAAGEVLRAAAPKLAEAALGIRNTDRAFQANPGRAVLRETSALSPGIIGEQAETRLGELKALQRGFTQSNPRMVSLFEPTDAVTNAMQAQAAQNSASGVERLDPLRQQLMVQTEPRGGFPVGVTPTRRPGALIPMQVPGEEALDLRQGVGNFQADKPWTGKVSADPVTGAVRNAYGALTRNLHNVYPEIAPLDARMHDLIPVAQRASEVGLHASTLQRVAGRFARPTGALIGATGGAAYGYHKGGVPEAVAMGLTGLVAPEVISSPRVQMGIARGLYRGGGAVGRYAAGAGLNAARRFASAAPPLSSGQLALRPPAR